MDPALRSVLGMLLLLALIAVWAIIVASFSGLVGQLAWPLQAVFYLLAGIVWVLPAKPVMRWTVTGRWRA